MVSYIVFQPNQAAAMIATDAVRPLVRALQHASSCVNMQAAATLMTLANEIGSSVSEHLVAAGGFQAVERMSRHAHQAFSLVQRCATGHYSSWRNF